jgi:hypothetical protein
MAVVQISRIQIRRGQANSGTGLPQLASGEMAWAVDTQELYIGNGSVAEGSPGVGNTKILTELDLSVNGNLLNLIQYQYKASDASIQTGSSPNNPVLRSIQSRFDDFITAVEFGAVGDGVTDDTAALQRAINQLFKNSAQPSSGSSASAIKTRVTLQIPPGKYVISSTLLIPSFATIVGAGLEKTYFIHSGSTPVIQFVGDTHTVATSTSEQPRYITLKDISITTTSTDQTLLLLNSVANSRFENLYLGGGSHSNTSSRAIEMQAFSTAAVTCQKNLFRNIRIYNCYFGVLAKYDIQFNKFEDCFIDYVTNGFALGIGSNGATTGQQTGPVKNEIVNCVFTQVYQWAVYIERGINNSIKDCDLGTTGANNGNVTLTQYPQIYFKTVGNIAVDNKSDRTNQFAETSLSTLSTNYGYVPEITGPGTFKSWATRTVILSQNTNLVTAFNLPVPTGAVGGTTDVNRTSISYTVSYNYKSNTGFSRSGIMQITADTADAKIQFEDEYNFAGTDSNGLSYSLIFSAQLVDAFGNSYTGSIGQVVSGIAVQYLNYLSGDTGTMSYSYISTQ